MAQSEAPAPAQPYPGAPPEPPAQPAAPAAPYPGAPPEPGTPPAPPARRPLNAQPGTAPPAPRGVHETMCYPLGVWSHCGNAWGTNTTYGCPGPGLQGSLSPASGALWVLSKFNLTNYLGARVQIRWIGSSWEFDLSGPSQDYQTYGCGAGTCWNNSLHEDGWWVDDISITGAITTQASPVPDPDTPPAKERRARAYRAQAAFLLRHSDLLVAVADADESGRAGGTLETVRGALEFDLPVVFIDAASGHDDGGAGDARQGPLEDRGGLPRTQR